MQRFMKSLVLFSSVFHLAVFVVEAFLWMRPSIHEAALPRLVGAVGPDLHEQALTLRALLVNQGFYNLFLALAGAVGLYSSARGNEAIANTLMGYMCLSAAGAGVVLALSTTAYIGASLQAVPAALALVLMMRLRASERTGSVVGSAKA